jgi:hypothetical protein
MRRTKRHIHSPDNVRFSNTTPTVLKRVKE